MDLQREPNKGSQQQSHRGPVLAKTARVLATWFGSGRPRSHHRHEERDTKESRMIASAKQERLPSGKRENEIDKSDREAQHRISSTDRT